MTQRRFYRRAWIVGGRAAVLYLAGAAIALAQGPAVQNQFSNDLLRLPPQEQAAKLADHIGIGCIGTKPFYMGTTKTGPAVGFAYWSVTCAGAESYVVQISPGGITAATGCGALKSGGEGRECYKTF